MESCDLIAVKSRNISKQNLKLQSKLKDLCQEYSCQHYSDESIVPARTTNCLVVFWDNFHQESEPTMRLLCADRKKCIAMKIVDTEEDLNIDIPITDDLLPPEKKFSLQHSWVGVKESRSGHIVKLSCKNKSVTWLQGDQDGKF